MSVSETECARQILQVTPHIGRWLAGRLRRETELANFTMPQFRVLLFVQQRDGCSQNDVARWREVAPATMSRTVDALVDKGLLERRRSPSDRRRVFLHLTPAGERFVAELQDHLVRSLAAELVGTTAEQRAFIVSGLSALNAMVDRKMEDHEAEAGCL